VGYTGPPEPMAQRVTELLLAWSDGDQAALEQLIPLVHAELGRVARHYMAGERRGHTLQPTALVNEVYLRLVDLERVRWQNRAHFMAVAARLMRRVLIDFARSRGYQKRGGNPERVALDESLLVDVGRGYDLQALDEALDQLARLDPRKSQIVVLRFFGGLSVDEVAAVLEISPATVTRDWKLAKSWLLRELDRTQSDPNR
jgi:RNA polymerase sigma-70 factor (ECF subfamily)